MVERAHLGTMLSQLDASIEQVRLATRELVPLALDRNAPFWKQRFFQKEEVLDWEIFDPLTKRTASWHGFLGHREGKCLVRTTCEAQGYDPHRWVVEQGDYVPERPEYVALNTIESGFHLHFFIVNQRHWIEKFRKMSDEPETWPCGHPVELPELWLGRASSRLSDKELAGYFQRWIARSEGDIQERARRGLLSLV